MEGVTFLCRRLENLLGMPPNFSSDSVAMSGEELENPFSSDTASVKRKTR